MDHQKKGKNTTWVLLFVLLLAVLQIQARLTIPRLEREGGKMFFPDRALPFGKAWVHADYDSACIPIVSITVSLNNICAGTGVTFIASAINGGTNARYSWKKNNAGVGVENNNYYTSVDFYDGDVVVCEYTCRTPCGFDTTIVSNAITMRVINDVSPTITITGDGPVLCQDEKARFTATANFRYGEASYQWLVNSIPVGNNSQSFSSQSLAGDVSIACVLAVVTPGCPTPVTISSNVLQLRVDPLLQPAVSITASDTAICSGTPVTFSASGNGGNKPSYQWRVNGMAVGTGTPTFTTSSLQNGDRISCAITIDANVKCFTTKEAVSNEIVMQVRAAAAPSIRISAPRLDVCAGSPVEFTAIVQNAGPSKTYQWKVNGAAMGNDSPRFSSSQFADGDIVVCSLKTDVPGCPSLADIVSNAEVVSIRDTPVISINPTELSVMAGERALVTAVVTGNPVRYQWSPAAVFVSPRSLSTATIPLLADTTFSLQVSDQNGCTATKEMVVTVRRAFYMPSAFTPNGDGRNDVFRVPSGVTIQVKEFTVFDRWGARVFTTTDATRGWNGNRKGRPAGAGTYAWLVRGIGPEGEVLRTGTVTLVR